ncbi:hypothetical protein AVEN_26942-1 [Araneus ventricosus]|uniref:Uncharacterized protein n=1 Tax=Araneus ventricosus TaxID=182803 RepID=A0A4Y2WK94_ARAVE|nr:hypothetical protein AVEN_26942-1 [Araneus ventricosus]
MKAEIRSCIKTNHQCKTSMRNRDCGRRSSSFEGIWSVGSLKLKFGRVRPPNLTINAKNRRELAVRSNLHPYEKHLECWVMKAEIRVVSLKLTINATGDENWRDCSLKFYPSKSIYGVGSLKAGGRMLSKACENPMRNWRLCGQIFILQHLGVRVLES